MLHSAKALTVDGMHFGLLYFASPRQRLELEEELTGCLRLIAMDGDGCTYSCGSCVYTVIEELRIPGHHWRMETGIEMAIILHLRCAMG